MTASPRDRSPFGNRTAAGGPSPTARLLAALIFLVSAGGLTAHAAFYVLGSDDTIGAFVHGAGAPVSLGLAFVSLAAGHVHYWRTRMRLDIASRVLAYLWILSLVLFLHRAAGGFSLVG